MKFILGRKLEMSQIFKENGEVVPVTVIQAGPCIVTQVKDQKTDSYTAVQVGFEEKKHLGKSTLGRVKGLKPVSTFREFRLTPEESSVMKRGQVVTVGVFNPGELVKVTGISKGKGFSGVVKRHHFKGQSTSHGTKDQVRMPGSSGMGGVQRVFRNTRKPGRMGGDQITVTNLEIIKIDPEKNILYIKGAVPGARNTLISIYNGLALEVNLLGDLNVAEVMVEATPVAPVETNETTVTETPVVDLSSEAVSAKEETPAIESPVEEVVAPASEEKETVNS